MESMDQTSTGGNATQLYFAGHSTMDHQLVCTLLNINIIQVLQ